MWGVAPQDHCLIDAANAHACDLFVGPAIAAMAPRSPPEVNQTSRSTALVLFGGASINEREALTAKLADDNVRQLWCSLTATALL